MGKSSFAALLLLVVAGITGGAGIAAAHPSHGAPAAAVAEKDAAAGSVVSPLGDSGWS
ncbi:hypothetical protein ACH47Z_18920 [Streptomyces sp. NPDC020192]|uniref:hypothetical protein n=1 Tax=Streptomyces sp. NPDC020192 TaxID=3365066 RepID=UPI0037A095D6